MSKRDDKRHKYALMISAHRDEWTKFGQAQFKKPFDKDRSHVRAIFAATSSPEEATKRINSYFKGPSRPGWMDATKTVWLSTGEATITYMHAYLTDGKLAYPTVTRGQLFYAETKDPAEEAAQQAWIDSVKEKIKTSFQGKIKDVTDETASQVRKILAQGVDNGDGNYKIGQAVDEALKGSWPGRGERIARTEANSSMNWSTLKDAMFSAPDLKKIWATTGMENVRQWHQDAEADYADGIPQDEPFIVMEESLDCPGDEVNGSGANVINCACCMLFE